MSLIDIINKFETGDFGSKPITNKGLGKSKFKDRMAFWNGDKSKNDKSEQSPTEEDNIKDEDADDKDVSF